MKTEFANTIINLLGRATSNVWYSNRWDDHVQYHSKEKFACCGIGGLTYGTSVHYTWRGQEANMEIFKEDEISGELLTTEIWSSTSEDLWSSWGIQHYSQGVLELVKAFKEYISWVQEWEAWTEENGFPEDF